MEEQTIRRAYEGLIKYLPFVPDEQEPYLVKLPGGNIGKLTKYGTFRKAGGAPGEQEPAMLRILPIPRPVDEQRQERIRGPYRALCQNTKAVRLPTILTRGENGNFDYEVWMDPGQKNLISLEATRSPFTEKVLPSVHQLAEAYWASQAVMAKALALLPALRAELAQTSSADYFQARFQKWNDLVKRNGIGVGSFLGSHEKEQIAETIEKMPLAKVGMELSRNLFGNTDIVVGEGKKFYFINGYFELKPVGFGIAAWLWNMMLYSAEKTAEQLLIEINQCKYFFFELAPTIMADNLVYGLKANLLERAYAALEVDCRYELSPLRFMTKPERQRVAENIHHFLRAYVPFK